MIWKQAGAGVGFLVVLLGCSHRPTEGELAARMETQDDSACRKLVADQGRTNDPNAYPQCRQNLIAYRQLQQQREAINQEHMAQAQQSFEKAGCYLKSINSGGAC
jgi:hypothetical protein